jgi:hypothetical protein
VVEATIQYPITPMPKQTKVLGWALYDKKSGKCVWVGLERPESDNILWEDDGSPGYCPTWRKSDGGYEKKKDVRLVRVQINLLPRGSKTRK